MIALEADGSGMYTVQGLWTQAREKLNILNRHLVEPLLRPSSTANLANVGAENPGPKARDMLFPRPPGHRWGSVAEGLGVTARRVRKPSPNSPPPSARGARA